MLLKNRLNTIRKKIEQINKLRIARKTTPYTLNPILSEKQIQDFEKEFQISLPEEYRQFLLQVGDGNHETHYRHIRPLLDTVRFNWEDIDERLPVHKPFPFDGTMGQEILTTMFYRYYPAEKVQNILDTTNEIEVPGCLILNYEGWGSSFTGLVVSGEQRGKIWAVNDLYHPQYFRKSNMFIPLSFLDWVESLLDRELGPPTLELVKNNPKNVSLLDLSGEAQEWQKEVTIEEVFRCTNLEFLDLSRCYKLSSLPESIGNLKKLVELKFNGGSLKKLPANIGKLQNLEILELTYQDLRRLPSSFGELKQLKKLSLYWNSSLKKLPASFSKLKNLVSLHISHCDKLDWADAFTKICRLPLVDTLHVEFEYVPQEISLLNNIKYLSIQKIYGAKKVILTPQMQTLSSLESLNLSECGLTKVPSWIGKLKNLKSLYLSKNQLQTLPSSLGALKNLTFLSLDSNNLKGLPESLSKLTALEKIELDYNLDLDLEQACPILGELPRCKEFYLMTNHPFPKNIGHLKNATDLILFSYSKEPQVFPEKISELSDLKYLKLETEGKLVLPPQFASLKNLNVLLIEAKGLTLPKNFGELTNLRELRLSDCDLKRLPESFSNLKNLETLYLEGNPELDLVDAFKKISRVPHLKFLRISAKKLPPEVGLCTQLKKLEIYNHPDYKNYEESLVLPLEIGNLRQLQELDLSDNHLAELPETLGKLEGLRLLDLSKNALTQLQDSLGFLKNLQTLYVYNNKLKSLPLSLKNLSQLRFLDISMNQIADLPAEFKKWINLETFLMDENAFKKNPNWISKLPKLRYFDLK